MGKNVHDLLFTKPNGKPLPLSDYSGKVLLVVNTATGCMFKPQFGQLEILYQLYKKRGFSIIAVPSNSFAGQEPKSDTEIAQFCALKKIHYTVVAKEQVWGKYAHPFFERTRQTFGLSSGPFWNFYKYLVAPDGTLMDFFIPFTSPLNDRVKNAIEKLLPK